MEKESFEKLILNSQEVLDEVEFLVVGSQSILGSPKYEEIKDNPVLFYSKEIDLICLNHTYQESLVLEAVFGEISHYDQAYDSHCQIVEEDTCYLIKNYQHRLNKLDLSPKSKFNFCNIYFLDEETLFISKLLVGRDKDNAFCQEMVNLNLIHQDKIKQTLFLNKDYLINKYSTLNEDVIFDKILKIDFFFKNKKELENKSIKNNPKKFKP